MSAAWRWFTVASGLAALGAPLAVESQAPADTGSPMTTVAAQARIAALKVERTRLQDLLRASLPEDARLEGAPPGDVLIGLPAPLIETIVSEAVSGPLRNIRLTLKDVVKVETADVIRAKTFLGTMTLGRYDLAVHVREVRAAMKPALPHLTFGSNRIAFELPVRVQSGDVRANLTFRWDGRKLAGVVCGDLSTERALRASVPPIDIRLRGRFDIAASGERLFVKPRISPIDMSFKVEPEESTWAFIDSVIESKNAVCEKALRKAAVGEKVKALVLGKGFKVRLPTNWLRPMNLPAAFRDTVEVKGRSAGLAVSTAGVSITKTRVWYGARLAFRRAPSTGR